MENCGFRTHLMVIYLSFDRALNNKSSRKVSPNFSSAHLFSYFSETALFDGVWFLLIEGGLVYSVLSSLRSVTGQFGVTIPILLLSPHSPVSGSPMFVKPFRLTITSVQCQKREREGLSQKTDLIRILSDVLSACRGSFL